MRRGTVLLSSLLATLAVLPCSRAAAAADPSDTCTSGTLLAGYAGPVSLVLRVDQAGGVTLVCVAADDGAGFHAGGLLQVAPPATVSLQPDPEGTDQPPVPAAPPVPSGTCQAQAGSTRVVDMELPAGERVWIYLAPDAAGLQDLCAGVGGPLLALGARISQGDPVPDSAGNNATSTWTPDGP